MARPGLSRRDALRKGLAAAAAAGCKPGGSEPGDSGVVPGQIDHVIMIMMENRSYDHWLGARTLEEGLTAEDGLTAEHSNPDSSGTAVAAFPTEEPCLDDPPHSWTSTSAQINGGAMDGFVTQYANRVGGTGAGVMGYQRRTDLPVTWALADAFTVCDRWFCSVPGPTWPNRLYGHMASSEGQKGNNFPESGFYTERSIWQALDEIGVEWAYYYADVPFIGLLADHWDDTKCDLIERFFQDVERGTLPPVCSIDPAFSYNDNHPPHHPKLGELFLGAIYEALAASSLWDRCLVVLTYDEHGGFYDHVAPPTTDDDRASDGFDQLGVRVPTLLVGPWVKQGVDSTVYDHTSWIRFVCDQLGIEPWNARLKAANSIASGIDWDRMATGEPLPAVGLPAFDFDPDSVPDECFYGRAAHLEKLAEHLLAHGITVRLGDPRHVRSPFIRAWRDRGLIG